MKRFVIIFIIMFLFINCNSKIIDNKFDKSTLTFNDCSLNTNNFINIFSNLNDYKILEITPYNDDKSYIFYSDDLDYILSSFKNEYINNYIMEGKFTNNICIKEVKMYASNDEINDLKKHVKFKN